MEPYSYQVRLYELQDSELHDIARSASKSVISKKFKFALYSVVALSVVSVICSPIAPVIIAFHRNQTERRAVEGLLKLKYIKDLQIDHQVHEPTTIKFNKDATVDLVLGERTRAMHQAYCKAAGFIPSVSSNSYQAAAAFASDKEVIELEEAPKSYYGTFGSLPLIAPQSK